jgi:hypothetical protein
MLEIAELVAQRFPKVDLFTAQALGVSKAANDLVIEEDGGEPNDNQLSCQRPTWGVEAPQTPVPVKLAPERFPLKAALTREAHEDLRRAQELLGHQVPLAVVRQQLGGPGASARAAALLWEPATSPRSWLVHWTCSCARWRSASSP